MSVTPTGLGRITGGAAAAICRGAAVIRRTLRSAA